MVKLLIKVEFNLDLKYFRVSKLFIAVIFVFSVLFSSVFLNAQDNQKYRPERKKNQSLSSCCFETSCAMFIINAFVTYTEFPYDPYYEDNFIIMPDFSENKEEPEEKDDEAPPAVYASYNEVQFEGDYYKDQEGNYGFFNAELLYLNSFGDNDFSGYELNARGRFISLLGYELNSGVYNIQNKGVKYISGGFNIPFIQHDFLTIDFCAMYGYEYDGSSSKGWAWALKMYSYPIKPFSLYYTIERKYFSDYINYQYRYAVGVLLNRFEINLGYERITEKISGAVIINDTDYNSVFFSGKIWL